ncbi:MAG TPA: pyridoxal phosphate-dependent aminotransferase [Syntrophaceae bacterium]|nr:pyridoxal phosphate-dependent aminotransferase [Syntrophaceae bacterium]
MNRIADMSPFLVMDILEKAKSLEAKGKNVVHLEVGEPDFPTPACIVNRAIRAMETGKTKYTHSLGIPELRQAISSYYVDKYGVEINPERILITSGSSPGMLLILSCLLESDGEVILSNPHYACYPNFIRFLGGKPIFFPVYEEERYEYHPERIKSLLTRHTKAVLINSPANPTGACIDTHTMKEIADLGCCIVSDEIYHELRYQGKDHTILEFTENAFVLNGFSKRYSMTGWRLGWVVAPQKYVRRLQKMHQNFFICANNFVQHAGVAAIREAEGHVKEMVAIYDERRRFLIDALLKIGFHLSYTPTGAYYIIVNARDIDTDSYRLSLDILEKAYVALTPGIDFGTRAEGYLRFSYANSLQNIKEGLARLATYLGQRNKLVS